MFGRGVMASLFFTKLIGRFILLCRFELGWCLWLLRGLVLHKLSHGTFGLLVIVLNRMLLGRRGLLASEMAEGTWLVNCLAI